MKKRVYLSLLVLVVVIVFGGLAACDLGPVSVAVNSTSAGPCPEGCPFVKRDGKYYVCSCTRSDGRVEYIYLVDEQTHEEKAGAPSASPSEQSIWYTSYFAPKWSDKWVYYFTEAEDFPSWEPGQDAFGRTLGGGWAYKFDVARQCVARTKVWVPAGTEGYAHIYEGSAEFCR